MANVILESHRGLQPVPIEDELLRGREIYFTESVTDESVCELIKQLKYLEREAPDEEITLYINSPGGAVQPGLAAYDLIMLMHAPVRTVCLGTCASMGAILFLAGEKREMMKHGRIMIHDPAFGGNHSIGGKKPHEVQTELDNLNRCKEALARIISERTGKKIEEVYDVTVEDTYYNPEEAVEFGLATGIITEKGAV